MIYLYLFGTCFHFIYVFMIISNIQKITCIILRNLFGLDLFSHQSCATGTLLLQKKIYPRKSSLNLKQLIFFMFLIRIVTFFIYL